MKNKIFLGVKGVKPIAFLFLTLLMILPLSSCYNKENREEILKVYNWGDYIDEDILAEFPKWYEEQTGKKIRVIYQTFDINEVMLTKIERGHEDYYVVCPSEYIIERMLRKDLLLPIDTAFGKTPCGILYNKVHVPIKDAQTWGTLWNSKYRGKLLMKDSYRDSYGTALIWEHRKELAAGKVTVPELMNDYSSKAVAIVEKQLKALKPNIEEWEADFGKETMTKGKAYLNMTWSGDAVWAIEEAEKVGVDLGYEVPKEGSNVWFDGWVIPKYSRNPKAASYFINYLCREDVALANMETTGYVSSVAGKKVFEAMSDREAYPETGNLAYFVGEEGRDAHLNPIMYPDSMVVARCAMIHDAGDHNPGSSGYVVESKG